MKKEVIIAIAIGLISGLIITYGVYQAKLALSKSSSQEEIEQNISPTPAGGSSGKLAIHSPEDQSISKDKKITVTGNTQTNNFIVVFINNQEVITTADSSGNFAVEVDLEDGSNVISVYSVDEDGLSSSERKEVIVYEDSF
jgi:hypothetical protein